MNPGCDPSRRFGKGRRRRGEAGTVVYLFGGGRAGLGGLLAVLAAGLVAMLPLRIRNGKVNSWSVVEDSNSGSAARYSNCGLRRSKSVVTLL